MKMQHINTKICNVNNTCSSIRSVVPGADIKAVTSYYIPPYLSHTITCPCPWYPLMAQHPSCINGICQCNGDTHRNWKFSRGNSAVTNHIHERHGVSNHWQHDYLSISLFSLTTRKTAKLCITPTTRQIAYQVPVTRKSFSCHATDTCTQILLKRQCMLPLEWAWTSCY